MNLPPFVVGEIYVIENQHPDRKGKTYIGQTRSHVLNHGKYRPYGAERRFAAHMSEAKSGARNQSWKLNHAMLKYGVEYFAVSVLWTCPPEEADAWEEFFIELFDTIKDGYNIQAGGRAPPVPEESRCQIARSLSSSYNDRRVTELQEYQFEGIRLTKYLDKGVSLYLTNERGVAIKFTRFYGRKLSFEESIASAKTVALALVKGDQSKITVKPGLPPSASEFDRQDDQIAGSS